jgi:hypothetical protein
MTGSGSAVAAEAVPSPQKAKSRKHLIGVYCPVTRTFRFVDRNVRVIIEPDRSSATDR